MSTPISIEILNTPPTHDVKDGWNFYSCHQSFSHFRRHKAEAHELVFKQRLVQRQRKKSRYRHVLLNKFVTLKNNSLVLLLKSIRSLHPFPACFCAAIKRHLTCLLHHECKYLNSVTPLLLHLLHHQHRRAKLSLTKPKKWGMETHMLLCVNSGAAHIKFS